MAGLCVDMAALSLLSLPSNPPSLLSPSPCASHRSWVSPSATPPLPRSSLTVATSFAVSASGGQRCDGKTVVVTRERGKNDKLMAVLGGHGISCLELPLIEHEEGPDLTRLPETIRDCLFDWIVLTSPEAASIFVDAWKIAGFPNVRLAVVGSGTAQVLENAKVDGAQIDIGFMPSKANAKVLSEELPRVGKVDGKVLFPASLKASNELERVLSERGFDVVRLNTYTTKSVKLTDPIIATLATSAPVVSLASPTAVCAWVDLIDAATWNGAAACIGQTSATAARKAGLKNIFYPENPGLDGSL